MNKTTLSLGITSAMALSAITPTAFAEDSITDAVKNGEAHLNLRLRYEDVDQSSPANKTADALTLKTRLNYKTGSFQGFSAFVEMDDVTALNDDDYNSTTNGNVDKAKMVANEALAIYVELFGAQSSQYQETKKLVEASL